jgi:1-deoxy-D-xylulose-5-phosphate synthase
MERLLEGIQNPGDLRRMRLTELPKLAAEIREEILTTVSKTGGHLASSLGAVELAIALHYVLNTPHDVVLWDVGHQVYAHKILTGRFPKFSTLRQLGGLSGFPNKDESTFDLVTCGHASTSISTALGIAAARDLLGESKKVMVVIGDASLAGGMAFEALNHTGHLKKDMVVILNDNELSISPSIGALSRYLNRIITNPAYNKIRKDVEKLLKRIPRFGFRAYRAARRLEEGLKNLLVPGMLFEELGFRYFGPIDGHNIAQLVGTLRNIVKLNEPILMHVITKKGKGYSFAEANPADFHGTGPFNKETGEKIPDGQIGQTFTDAFGQKMVELAAKDSRVIGISAAMLDGTGLNKFASLFPNRFFDVGISEEHAVTFAAGLALAGFRPFVAIYSTFLQRGYDQIIHDVCLQGLPVVFCLDRAGIVGEDGPTHHGMFDIAYLRHMPNMTLMAPKNPEELEMMLDFALAHAGGPVAIRYPKGAVYGSWTMVRPQPIQLGKAEVMKEGDDIALFALGSMVDVAMKTEELLYKYRLNTFIVNARFVKPIDTELILNVCSRINKIVVLEEGVVDGGFGSAVLEVIERANIKGIRVKRIGLPNSFIEHGTRPELLGKYHLTPPAVCAEVINQVIR